MADWNRVKIDFKTMKLGAFIEPVKMTIAQSDRSIFGEVYGVTNTEGIVKTGKKASADISKYIIIDKNYFAYNPYRINVGSIGANFSGLKGCVSPAYVVFKTKGDLDPVFLWYYLKSDFGNHLINWYGNRGGVRNALRYDDLCKIDIPAINYEKQLEVIRKVDYYQKDISKLETELINQESLLKKLRQAVLQEAVEGKLTKSWRECHPELVSGSNHAARLLEKIKAEKERLAKNTKGSKKIKELPPISDDEKPFDLPEGWAWCRLGELRNFKYSLSYGVLVPGPNIPNGIPFVRVQDLDFAKEGYKPTKSISKNIDSKYIRTRLNGGEILICVVGSVGKIAIVPSSWAGANIARAICRFMPSSNLNLKYMYNCLKSPIVQHYFNKGYKSIQPTLNVSVLEKTLLPIPPLTEQQAIIEKVDRLMAKIDALELQVKERKEQAEQLMQAVLREAFDGE